MAQWISYQVGDRAFKLVRLIDIWSDKSRENSISEYKTVERKQMNLQKPIAMLVRIMAPSDSYQGRQLLSKLPGKILQITFLSDSPNFSSEARKVGLDKICNVVSLHLPKLKKWEVRAGTDTELKLNDLFKYYDYETSAAKDLLYRYIPILFPD